MRAQWYAAEGAQGQLTFARLQTWIAAGGTILIFIALIYSARGTRAAIAAKAISRDAYIADQRPWVSVEVEIGGPIRWSGHSDCGMTFKVTLENVGRTAALNTWVDVEILAGSRGRNPRAEQIRFADKMLAMARGGNQTL